MNDTEISGRLLWKKFAMHKYILIYIIISKKLSYVQRLLRLQVFEAGRYISLCQLDDQTFNCGADYEMTQSLSSVSKPGGRSPMISDGGDPYVCIYKRDILVVLSESRSQGMLTSPINSMISLEYSR